MAALVAVDQATYQAEDQETLAVTAHPKATRARAVQQTLVEVVVVHHLLRQPTAEQPPGNLGDQEQQTQSVVVP
jgi:hypothetical protein